ncbi:peptidase inhibitor family I36 protein [Streptomyces sp. QH1-20]|uniref:peptidase inhibitor family I36 protein n=1 Tax=Streptomyces sp. QH1-20 TaxID=3240934 RepID=UPI003512A695
MKLRVWALCAASALVMLISTPVTAQAEAAPSNCPSGYICGYDWKDYTGNRVVSRPGEFHRYDPPAFSVYNNTPNSVWIYTDEACTQQEGPIPPDSGLSNTYAYCAWAPA